MITETNLITLDASDDAAADNALPKKLTNSGHHKVTISKKKHGTVRKCGL